MHVVTCVIAVVRLAVFPYHQALRLIPPRTSGSFASQGHANCPYIYSKSLPVPVVGIYEFTKGGEMSVQIARPETPETGVKRVEGSYKVSDRKVEMVWRIVESKDKEKVTMEIVKLTDSSLHLKHDDGKLEEFDRVKEKEKKDK